MKKIQWITRTAVLLATLIVLQSITKPYGQLITGSCVNTVLAISSLVCGMSSGVVIAVFSPILAYLLGIAPQIVTVPAIMVGNTVYVVILSLIAGQDNSMIKSILAWITASVIKFVVLYILVVKVICGLLSTSLLEAGVLKEAMLKALPKTFAYPQLITALIGGAIALAIAPVVKKAINKK